MKKIFFLPLAAFIVAACSEPTTSTATSDLSPSYAKPTPPPTEPTFTTTITNDFYTFTSSGISAAGSSFITGLEAGGQGTASGPATVVAPSPSFEEFLGRFVNVDTEARLVVTNGSNQFLLQYDLYTIGSWDGKGKQAQSGFFEANVFSVSFLCEGAIPDGVLFTSTFSNQLTVQQDYPANTALGQSGGNKAATGSFDTDALNYRSRPDLSNTPPFRSFGDVSYHMQLSGPNPCGVGQTVTFVFGSTAPNQQSNYDESWGIDNVRIRTGT